MPIMFPPICVMSKTRIDVFGVRTSPSPSRNRPSFAITYPFTSSTAAAECLSKRIRAHFVAVTVKSMLQKEKGPKGQCVSILHDLEQPQDPVSISWLFDYPVMLVLSTLLGPNAPTSPSSVHSAHQSLRRSGVTTMSTISVTFIQIRRVESPLSNTRS